MKNWIQFLPKRTHELNRKSKLINVVEFDLMEAQLKVTYLLETSKKLDEELKQEALKFNTLEEISQAIIKATKWNNTPTVELINPNNHEAKRENTS